MRSYDEFERLMYQGSDLLFSCVLSKTESREKALEIICRASEDYLECNKKFRNQNERYRFLAGCCERTLKAPLRGEFERVRLTESEYEQILASAKLYISNGGKPKKRKSSLIFAVIAIVAIILVAASAISFFYSDAFRYGMMGMQ